MNDARYHGEAKKGGRFRVKHSITRNFLLELQQAGKKTKKTDEQWERRVNPLREKNLRQVPGGKRADTYL